MSTTNISFQKSCNCGGCCQYKSIGGTIACCHYAGYCDYQAPKDGRTYRIEAIGKDDEG